MSGRKSKKSQRLGSSRRGPKGLNRNIEKDDDDDGFQQIAESEDGRDEFHTTSYYHATQFDHPPSLSIEQQTSALECPPHARDHKDSLMETELPERKRKMGSTRKSTGRFKGERKLDDVRTTEELDEEYVTQPRTSTTEEQHASLTEEEQSSFPSDLSLQTKSSGFGKESGTTLMFEVSENKEKDTIHHQEITSHSHEVVSDVPIDEAMGPSVHSIAVTVAKRDLLREDSVMFNEPKTLSHQETQIASTSGQKRRMGSTRRPLGGKNSENVGVQEHSRNMTENESKAEVMGEAKLKMSEEMAQTWDDVARDDPSSHTESALLLSPSLLADRAELKEPDVSAGTETMNQSVAFPLVDSEKPLPETFSHHGTPLLNEALDFKFGSHTEDLDVLSKVLKEAGSHLSDKGQHVSDTRKDTNPSYDFRDVNTEAKKVVLKQKEEPQLEELALHDQESSLSQHDIATLDNNYDCSMVQHIGGSKSFDMPVSNISHAEPTTTNLPDEMRDAVEERQDIRIEMKQENNVCNVASVTCDTLTDLASIMEEDEDPHIFAKRKNENMSDERGSETEYAFETTDQGEVKDHNVTQIIMDVRDNEKDVETSTETIWISHQKPCGVSTENKELYKGQENYSSNISLTHSPTQDDAGKMLENEEVRKDKKETENTAVNVVTSKSEEMFSFEDSASDRGSHAHQQLFVQSPDKEGYDLHENVNEKSEKEEIIFSVESENAAFDRGNERNEGTDGIKEMNAAPVLTLDVGDTDLQLEIEAQNKTFDSTNSEADGTEENINGASVLVRENKVIRNTVEHNMTAESDFLQSSPDAHKEALNISENVEKEVSRETILKQSDINIVPGDFHGEEAHSKSSPIVHKRKMGSTRRPLKGKKGQRKEIENRDENETLHSEDMINVEKETFRLESEPSSDESTLQSLKDGAKQQEIEICEKNDVGPVEGSASALLQSSCSSDLVSEKSTAISICHITESQTLTKINVESQENTGDAERLTEEDKDLQLEIDSQNKTSDLATSEAEETEKNIQDVSVTLIREVDVIGDTVTVESNMTTESDFLQTSPDAHMEALKVSKNAEKEVSGEINTIPEQSDISIIPADSHRDETHSKSSPVIHKRKMGSTRRPLKGNTGQRKDHNEKEIFNLEDEPSPDESRYTAVSICDVSESQAITKIHAGSHENIGDVERAPAEGDTESHSENKTFDSTAFEGEATEENICKASVLVREVEFIGDAIIVESNMTTESDLIQNNTSSEAKLEALKVSDNPVHEVLGETDEIPKQRDTTIIPEDTQKEEAHSKFTVTHKRKMGSTRRPLKGKNGQRKEIDHHDANETLDSEGMINAEKQTFSLENEPSSDESTLQSTKDGAKEQEMEICEKNDVGPVEGSESALLQSSCSSDLVSEESTAISICQITESQTLTKINVESQENTGDAERVAAEEDKDLQLEIDSQNKTSDLATSEAEETEKNIQDVSVTLIREVEVIGDTVTVESNMTTESDFLQTSPDAHMEALKVSKNAEKEVSGEINTIPEQSDISIIPADSHRDDTHSKSSPVIHKRKMGSTRRPLKGNTGRRKGHDEKEIFNLEDEPSPDESRYTAVSICDVSESQTITKIHAGSHENIGDVDIAPAEGDTESHSENKTFDSTAFEEVEVREVEVIGDTVGSNMTTESDFHQTSDANKETLNVSENSDSEDLSDELRNSQSEIQPENKMIELTSEAERAEDTICEASVSVREDEFTVDTVIVDSNMTIESDLLQSDTLNEANLEAPKVSKNTESVSAVTDSVLLVQDDVTERSRQTDTFPEQSDIDVIPGDSHGEEAHSKSSPIVHKRKIGSTRRPLKGKKGQRTEIEHHDENETLDSEDMINVEKEAIRLENEPSSDESTLQSLKDGVKDQEKEICEKNDVGPVEGSESALLQSSCSSDLVSEESTAISICHITESQTLTKIDEESQENTGDAERVSAEEDKDLQLEIDSQNNTSELATSEAEETEKNIHDASVLVREVEVIGDTVTVESNMTTESDFLQTSPDAHMEALKVSKNAEKEVSGEINTIPEQSDISIIPADSHRDNTHSKSCPVIHKRKMGSTRRPLKGNSGRRKGHDEKEIFNLEDEPSPDESRYTAVSICDVSESQTITKVHAGSHENIGDVERAPAEGDTESHSENKTFDSTAFEGEATEENICKASVLVREVEFIGDAIIVESNMTTESDLIQNNTSSEAKLEALKVSDNPVHEVLGETDEIPKQRDTTIIPEDTPKEEAHSKFTVTHKRKMGSTRRPLRGNKGQRKEIEHHDANETLDSDGIINAEKETISLENEPSPDESTLQSTKDGAKEQEMEICEKNDVGPVEGSESALLQSSCSSDLVSEESTAISICHITESQTLTKINVESQENTGDAERVAAEEDKDLQLEIDSQNKTSDLATSEAEETEKNIQDVSVTLIREVEVIGDTVTVESNMTTESDFLQTSPDAHMEAWKVSKNAEKEVSGEINTIPEQSDISIIPADSHRDETHSKSSPVIHKRKMGSTRRPLKGNTGRRKGHDEKEIFNLEDEHSPDESRYTAVSICDVSESQTITKIHAGSHENIGDVDIAPAEGDTESHSENKTFDSTAFEVEVREVEVIGDIVGSNMTTESDFHQTSDANKETLNVSENSDSEDLSDELRNSQSEIQPENKMIELTSEAERAEDTICEASVSVREDEFTVDTVIVDSNMTIESDLLQSDTLNEANLEAPKVSKNTESVSAVTDSVLLVQDDVTERSRQTDTFPEQSDIDVIPGDSHGEEAHSKSSPIVHKRKIGSTRRPLKGKKGQRTEIEHHDENETLDSEDMINVEKEAIRLENEPSSDESTLQSLKDGVKDQENEICEKNDVGPVEGSESALLQSSCSSDLVSEESTAISICHITESQTLTKINVESQENTGDAERVAAEEDKDLQLEIDSQNNTSELATSEAEETEKNIHDASVLVREVEVIGDTVTVESNMTTESDFLQTSPDAHMEALKVSKNAEKEVSGEINTIPEQSDISIIPADSHRHDTHSKSSPVIHKRKMGSTRRPLKGNTGRRKGHDEKEIFNLEDEPSPDESRYTAVSICDVSESQTITKVHAGSHENIGDVDIAPAEGDTESHSENKTFDSTAFEGEATEENICEASILVREVEFIGDAVIVESNMTTESDLIQNNTSSEAKLEALKVSDNPVHEVLGETDEIPKQRDTTIIPEDTPKEEAHSKFTVTHKRKMGSTRRPLRGNKGQRKEIEHHDANETLDSDGIINAEKETISLENEPSPDESTLQSTKDGAKEQEMEICEKNDVGPVEGSESALLQSSCSSDLVSEESTAISICHITESQTLTKINVESQENTGDAERVAAEEDKDLQLEIDSQNKTSDLATSEAEETEKNIQDVSVTLIREVEVIGDTVTVESNMTTESDFLQTSPDANMEALKVSKNAEKEVSGEINTIPEQSDISIIPADSHREEMHSKSSPVIHKRKMGSTRRPLKGNTGRRKGHDEKEIFNLEDEPSPDESRYTAVSICDVSESQTITKIHAGSHENIGDVDIAPAEGDTESHSENKTFDSTAFEVEVREVEVIGDTVGSNMTTESDFHQTSDANKETLNVSENSDSEDLSDELRNSQSEIQPENKMIELTSEAERTEDTICEASVSVREDEFTVDTVIVDSNMTIESDLLQSDTLNEANLEAPKVSKNTESVSAVTDSVLLVQDDVTERSRQTDTFPEQSDIDVIPGDSHGEEAHSKSSPIVHKRKIGSTRRPLKGKKGQRTEIEHHDENETLDSEDMINVEKEAIRLENEPSSDESTLQSLKDGVKDQEKEICEKNDVGPVEGSESALLQSSCSSDLVSEESTAISICHITESQTLTKIDEESQENTGDAERVSAEEDKDLQLEIDSQNNTSELATSEAEETEKNIHDASVLVREVEVIGDTVTVESNMTTESDFLQTSPDAHMEALKVSKNAEKEVSGEINTIPEQSDISIIPADSHRDDTHSKSSPVIHKRKMGSTRRPLKGNTGQRKGHDEKEIFNLEDEPSPDESRYTAVSICDVSESQTITKVHAGSHENIGDVDIAPAEGDTESHSENKTFDSTAFEGEATEENICKASILVREVEFIGDAIIVESNMTTESDLIQNNTSSEAKLEALKVSDNPVHEVLGETDEIPKQRDTTIIPEDTPKEEAHSKFTVTHKRKMGSTRRPLRGNKGQRKEIEHHDANETLDSDGIINAEKETISLENEASPDESTLQSTKDGAKEQEMEKCEKNDVGPVEGSESALLQSSCSSDLVSEESTAISICHITESQTLTKMNVESQENTGDAERVAAEEDKDLQLEIDSQNKTSDLATSEAEETEKNIQDVSVTLIREVEVIGDTVTVESNMTTESDFLQTSLDAHMEALKVSKNAEKEVSGEINTIPEQSDIISIIPADSHREEMHSKSSPVIHKRKMGSTRRPLKGNTGRRKGHDEKEIFNLEDEPSPDESRYTAVSICDVSESQTITKVHAGSHENIGDVDIAPAEGDTESHSENKTFDSTAFEGEATEENICKASILVREVEFIGDAIIVESNMTTESDLIQNNTSSEAKLEALKVSDNPVHEVLGETDEIPKQRDTTIIPEDTPKEEAHSKFTVTHKRKMGSTRRPLRGNKGQRKEIEHHDANETLDSDGIINAEKETISLENEPSPDESTLQSTKDGAKEQEMEICEKNDVGPVEGSESALLQSSCSSDLVSEESTAISICHITESQTLTKINVESQENTGDAERVAAEEDKDLQLEIDSQNKTSDLATSEAEETEKNIQDVSVTLIREVEVIGDTVTVESNMTTESDFLQTSPDAHMEALKVSKNAEKEVSGEINTIPEQSDIISIIPADSHRDDTHSKSSPVIHKRKMGSTRRPLKGNTGRRKGHDEKEIFNLEDEPSPDESRYTAVSICDVSESQTITKIHAGSHENIGDVDIAPAEGDTESHSENKTFDSTAFEEATEENICAASALDRKVEFIGDAVIVESNMTTESDLIQNYTSTDAKPEAFISEISGKTDTISKQSVPNIIPEDLHGDEVHSKLSLNVHKRKMGSTRRPLRGNKEQRKVRVESKENNGDSEGVSEEEDTETHSEIQNWDNMVDHNVTQEIINIRDVEDEERKTTKTVDMSVQELCDDLEQRSDASQTQTGPSQDDTGSHLVEFQERTLDFVRESCSLSDVVVSDALLMEETQIHVSSNDVPPTEVVEMNPVSKKSMQKRKMGSTRKRGKRMVNDEEVEEKEGETENTTIDDETTKSEEKLTLEEAITGSPVHQQLFSSSADKEGHGIQDIVCKSDVQAENSEQNDPNSTTNPELLIESECSSNVAAEMVSDPPLGDVDTYLDPKQSVIPKESHREDQPNLNPVVQKRKMGSTRKTLRGNKGLGRIAEFKKMDGDSEGMTQEQDTEPHLETSARKTEFDEEVEQNFPVEFSHPMASSNMFPKPENGVKEVSQNIPDLSEVSEEKGIDNTGNDSNSLNEAINLNEGTKDIFFLTVSHEDAHKIVSEPEQTENTQELRATQDDVVHENNSRKIPATQEKRRKMGSTRRNPRAMHGKNMADNEDVLGVAEDRETKKAADDLEEALSISQSKEVSSVSTTDLESEMFIGETDLKVENDHLHSSRPTVPETPENTLQICDNQLVNADVTKYPQSETVTTEKRRKMGSTRKNLREGKIQGKRDVYEDIETEDTNLQMSQDSEMSLVRENVGQQTTHGYSNQSEDSLLSEIERALNKTSQSSSSSDWELIVKEPNPDDLANAPDLNMPENSEIKSLQPMPSAHSEPNSPGGRRRKMGSTRKNPRQQLKAEREDEDKENGEIDENSKANKQEKKDLERVEVSVVHNISENRLNKEYLDVSSAHTSSNQLEESTNPVSQEKTSPSTKRKFGSRRANKGKQGLGRLADSDFGNELEDGDHKPDSSEVKDKLHSDDLAVCDPCLTLQPENQPASEQRNMEAKNEEAAPKGTVAGLVSLDQIIKHDSTGAKQTVNLKNRISDTEVVRFNVVMVGNSCVGKTSFIRRFHEGQFTEDYCSTIGVDTCIQTIALPDRTVKLQIWDTAGQERFHSITTQVFHKADGILLMYEITCSKSFISVRNWISQARERAPDDVIMMLLGNKNDAVKREVQIQEGADLAREYNIHFMECSAATGANVSESMRSLAELLVQRKSQKEKHTTLRREPAQKKSGCC